MRTIYETLKKEASCWRCLLILAFMLVSIGVKAQPETLPGVAPVDPPTGGMAVDGNLLSNTGVFNTAGDWFEGPSGDYLFNIIDGVPVPIYPTQSFYKLDLTGNANQDIFTQGSKFNDDPNTWRWTAQSAPQKNDINNAFVHFAREPNGNGGGDLWVIMAGDRKATNGTSYIDFEFLQNGLEKNPDGTFTSFGPHGGRTIGDFVFSIEYSNGGDQPNILSYRWAAVGAGYSYVLFDLPEGTGFAATNIEGPVEAPHGAFGSFTYEQFAFAEAAVNITKLLEAYEFDPCIGLSTVFVKTKASDALTAMLKDMVEPIQVRTGTTPILEIVDTVDPLCEDSGDGEITVSATEGHPPYTFELYLNNVLVDTQVADMAGQEVTFTGLDAGEYTIMVEDNEGCVDDPQDVTLIVLCDTPPEFIDPPGNISISCADASVFQPTMLAFANDDPDCPISGQVEGVITGDFDKCDGGTLYQTWTYTDLCGRTIEYVQTITVQPAPVPVLTEPELPENLTCAEADAFMDPANATYTNSEEGDCEISGYIVAQVTHDWDLCDGGTITVVYSGEDVCGNELYYSHTIEVAPAATPELSVPELPANLTCAEADAFMDPANATYTNSEEGDCEISGYIVAQVTHDWDLCDGGTITVVYSGEDVCGNELYYSHTIEVAPAATPELSVPELPANLTCAEADAFMDPANATYTNSEEGDCEISGYIVAQVTHDWDLCDGGTITVVYSGEDVCGNELYYSHTIEVAPAATPELSVPELPANLTCAEADAFMDPANATYTNSEEGDCEISGYIVAQVTHDWDLCDGGTITVVYSGEDVCGNELYYSHTIEVAPAATPELSVPELPANLTCAEADAFMDPANATYTNSEEGDCEISGYIVAQVTHDWDLCDGGTITVVYSGEDVCGNELYYSHTIEVAPAATPELSVPELPANLTCAEADAFMDPANATYTNSEEGDCEISGYIVAQVTHDWDLCDGGTITVVYSGEDVCGNELYYSHTIEVAPAATPELSVPELPANLTCAEADAFMDPANATYTNSEEGDCEISGYIVAQVTHDWDLCDGGTITVVYSGEDVCGNELYYSHTIEVAPAQAPDWAELPADIVLTCEEASSFEASLLYFTNDDAGNCLIEGSVLGVITGGFDECGGTLYQTWTFEDECGRVIEHVQTITVLPAPMAAFIDPPADYSISCELVGTIEPSYLDYSNEGAGVCLIEGSVLGVIDIVDSDPCDGYLKQTWTFVDECGREISYTQTIHIFDNDPPVFADCPEEPVDLGCIIEEERPTVEMAIAYAGEATDNCTDVTFSAVPGEIIPGENCTFTQTWVVIATDECENTAECEVTFMWIEADEPEWLYTEGQLNQTFECGTDALAYAAGLVDLLLTEEQFLGCFDDIEESLLQTDEVLTGDIDCEFELTLTYTLTDICGQEAEFVVVLNVEYAPLVVPANLVEEVECYDDVEQRDPVDVFDSCEELLEAELIDTEDTFDGCEGVVTYTWLYTDCAGNTGTWQQIVTILPTTDLAWDQDVLPADLDLECTDDVPAMVELTASNNCEEGIVAVMASSLVTDDECPYAYVITRSWFVEDACGNTLYHEQVINVDDTEAPELINGLPVYLSFECGEEVILPEPVYEDNCSPVEMITVYCEVVVGDDRFDCEGFEFPEGEETTIVFYAEDECGNVSEEVSVIIYLEPCLLEFCSYTMGFYGNYGGKHCDGRTTWELINDLITDNGPVVVGIAEADGGSGSLTIETADCVIKLLPAGGPSRSILGHFDCDNLGGLTHPNHGRLRNTLLGQTIALQLNLWLSEDLGDFQLTAPTFWSYPSTGCGEGEGNFPIYEEWMGPWTIPAPVWDYLEEDGVVTVQSILDLANRIINGEKISGITADAVNTAATAINEGFDECAFITYTQPEMDEEPETEVTVVSKGGVDLVVAPNPFRQQAQINVTVERDMDVTVEIYDMQGNRVAVLFEGLISAYDQRSFTYSGNRHDGRQIFLVVVRTPYGTTTTRMLQAR
jgi:hypothetical protein